MRARGGKLRVVAEGASAPPRRIVLEDAEFDAIFRAHARYVAAVACRLLGRDDEVDDAVQEVFLRAMSKLREHRGDEATRAWLRIVTVRIVRRRLTRRRWLRLFGAGDADTFAEVPTREATPEERATLREVYAALDALPVDLRIAWVLRHAEEERLEDVARACECSLATAKRRIAAAEAALARRLR
jgi:RNA polymerase sigma-70 factor (ECF subfamily)